MSHSFIKTRPDANHKEVVSDLKKRGVAVEDLSTMGGGIADIVTHFRGQIVFIEIKFGKRAELKKTQIGFLSRWPGRCGIARTSEEAYLLATESDRHELTPVQKNRLAAYHATMKEKKVHLETILKVINA